MYENIVEFAGASKLESRIIIQREIYGLFQGPSVSCLLVYTDKKENLIFLIYREIQSGAVAKSYMTNGLPKYGEIFALSSYIRKPFLIYDFATAPL